MYSSSVPGPRVWKTYQVHGNVPGPKGGSKRTRCASSRKSAKNASLSTRLGYSSTGTVLCPGYVPGLENVKRKTYRVWKTYSSTMIVQGVGGGVGSKRTIVHLCTRVLWYHSSTPGIYITAHKPIEPEPLSIMLVLSFWEPIGGEHWCPHRALSKHYR